MMTIPRLLRKANFAVPTTVHDWLIASVCFSGLLLFIRVIATGSLVYLFLPWNLLLAFIPYGITRWMTRNLSIVENKIKLVITLAVWLLFIPNSFYIITDLYHLSHPIAIGFRSAPQWFDLLLIFSFAWNGILCGIISLSGIESVISVIRGKGFSILLIFLVMWLCAFGIYIGRFLRYNSWDVLTDPVSLAGEIGCMLLHPFENAYAWGMTICYAVFMTLLYFTTKKLSENFETVRYRKQE
jgi:uncharacterized membrane protein